MKAFLIIACSNCNRFLLARIEQKTRTCPYCGFKVDIEKARKIAFANNAYEASTILRKMKRDSSQKRNAKHQKPF